MEFSELITYAQEKIAPKKLSPWAESGGVAAAILTKAGNIYTGVCIDTSCSMGFCAEHAAAAAMINEGEHHIAKVVAVDWQGQPMSPCGRCREFLSQLAEDNLSAQVLTKEGSMRLSQLLPLDWKDNLHQ
jgi:cytidine deaminase